MIEGTMSEKSQATEEYSTESATEKSDLLTNPPSTEFKQNPKPTLAPQVWGGAVPINTGEHPELGVIADPLRDPNRKPGPDWYWAKWYDGYGNERQQWVRLDSRDPNHSPDPKYVWDDKQLLWIPKPGSSLWTDKSQPPGPPVDFAKRERGGLWYWVEREGRWYSITDPNRKPPLVCSAGMYYSADMRMWLCYPTGGNISSGEYEAK